MKRLQREIEEVNRLFDEWERRAALEEERRNAAKAFNDRYVYRHVHPNPDSHKSGLGEHTYLYIFL